MLPNEKSHVMQKISISCSTAKVACCFLPASHIALTVATKKSYKESPDAA
jgi:hypothetical protein